MGVAVLRHIVGLLLLLLLMLMPAWSGIKRPKILLLCPLLVRRVQWLQLNYGRKRALTCRSHTTATGSACSGDSATSSCAAAAERRES